MRAGFKLWHTGFIPEIRLPGNEGGIRALVFDPASGNLLTSGSGDQYVRVFDLRSGKQVSAWFTDTPALAVVPVGGRVLVLDGKDVEVLDVMTGRILNVSSTDEFRVGNDLPKLTVLAESPSGSLLATAGERKMICAGRGRPRDQRSSDTYGRGHRCRGIQR